MVVRLFLGGFKFSHKLEPSLPTEQEVTERFGPTQAVEYHHNYLHFTLLDSLEQVKKLQAKYHGNVWKGAKIKLEIAKPVTWNVKTIDKEEQNKPIKKKQRPLQRHAADYDKVIIDAAGKVRNGWVRSKGGRHVMKELKIRKPDGKIKLLDLNQIYKHNITTFPEAEEASPVRLGQIWAAAGYTKTPVLPNSKNLSIDDESAKVKEEEAPTKNEIEKKEKQLCKLDWNELVKTDEPLTFSLFPSAEPAPVITPPTPPTKPEKVMEQPAAIAEPTRKIYFSNLPADYQPIVANFLAINFDRDEYLRQERPAFRRDLKQQVKQHFRRQRKFNIIKNHNKS